MKIWIETYDLSDKSKVGFIEFSRNTEIIKIDCFWRSEDDGKTSKRYCNFFIKEN